MVSKVRLHVESTLVLLGLATLCVGFVMLCYYYPKAWFFICGSIIVVYLYKAVYVVIKYGYHGIE